MCYFQGQGDGDTCEKSCWGDRTICKSYKKNAKV